MIDSPDSAQSPAQFVHIIYLKAGKKIVRKQPYHGRARIQYYLNKAGLIGARMRSRMLCDGKPARMSHTPKPGSIILLIPPGTPLHSL